MVLELQLVVLALKFDIFELQLVVLALKFDIFELQLVIIALKFDIFELQLVIIALKFDIFGLQLFDVFALQLEFLEDSGHYSTETNASPVYTARNDKHSKHENSKAGSID